jgi:hypothetical protein
MDLRAVMTPLNGPDWVAVKTPDSPLRVVEDVTPENAVLRVRAESIESHRTLFRREVYGKRVYATYRWYAPLLKPLTAVTVIGPLFLSFRDPHAHQGYPWRRRDYLRDVAAWFNPFSAVPTGPRQFAAEDSLIRIEVVPWISREVPLPDPNRSVTLRLDDMDVETAVSDAEGFVAFDLTPLLARETGERDVKLQLVTASPSGATAVLRYVVPARTVLQLIDKRPPSGGDSIP